MKRQGRLIVIVGLVCITICSSIVNAGSIPDNTCDVVVEDVNGCDDWSAILSNKLKSVNGSILLENNGYYISTLSDGAVSYKDLLDKGKNDNNTVYSITYKGKEKVYDSVDEIDVDKISNDTGVNFEDDERKAWVTRDVMGMSNEYGMGNSVVYLRKGITVELLEPYKIGYLKVSHNGSVSYVYSDCLSLSRIKDLLNIRYSDESIDTSYSDIINSEVSILPGKLLNSFIDSGWVVEVTDKDIGKMFTNGKFKNVKGLTVYRDRVIYLSSIQKDITDSVLHEFGHWVDMCKGFISDSKEFLSIYDLESDSFVSTFNVDFYYNNMEMFAEAFYRYLVSGDVLKANCPETYKFISEIVGEYL